MQAAVVRRGLQGHGPLALAPFAPCRGAQEAVAPFPGHHRAITEIAAPGHDGGAGGVTPAAEIP